MSTPAAKRRRIEAASTTLKKPFRSPFKTPAKTTAQRADQPLTPYTIANGSCADQSFSAKCTTISTNSSPSLTQSSTSGYLKKYGSGTMTAALKTDFAITQMMKTQRDLESQLRESRQQLDITKQALKIETDSNNKTYSEVDGELLGLIQKWKAVSRAAAEDLFTGIRERVNRMGGPKAWKEAKQRQQEFLAAFNNEAPVSELNQAREEGNECEKGDLYIYNDDEPETANERAAKAGSDTDAAEDEDDEFTIATMLRLLHINLGSIGYDIGQQCWVD